MKKRFTEEQIIGFLREVEAGLPIKELCGRLFLIEPGQPNQNAYIESFNGRLRDELSERTLVRQLGSRQGGDRGVAARIQPGTAEEIGYIPPGTLKPSAPENRGDVVLVLLLSWILIKVVEVPVERQRKNSRKPLVILVQNQLHMWLSLYVG